MTVQLDSGPAFGTVTLNADGSFTYTPDANHAGTDRFRYAVSDGTVSSFATVRIDIDPVNDAPVVANDSYATDEDTALTVSAPGVLGNDTDVDGDALTTVLVSNVSHGTLTLNADGSFTYTPNTDFNGTDSFTYNANDGALDSNIATVTITVNAVNDAPVAADDTASTTAGTPVTITVLANDTDVDGDPLSVSSVTQGSHGTVAINADGTVTYTPNAGFSGTDSFTYTAGDGTADSNVATVTVQVRPAIQIIDNGDTGFSTAGSWTARTQEGYQYDMHYSAKGTGADVATWTFTGLQAGTYQVAATWNAHSNRATDSPFTVLDGSSALGTVQVNQELAPNDFSDAGASWEVLGEFTISGDTLVVQLSDAANEYVIADAIRIEKLQVAGALSLSFDPASISENGGTATGTLTRTGDTSQELVVDLSSSDTTEATVPASVSIPAGAATATFLVTAQDDTEADGTQTVTITASTTGLISGSAVVEVTDDEPLPQVQIIDNGDAGFSTAGDWTLNATQGHQSDIHYSAKGSGADVATWTFTGLQAGTYQVAATWNAHSNRATDSPFTVLDGSSALGTVQVNQELAPNDFSDAGASWEVLGEFTISGDTLVVQLSDAANEYVIADAIRIEKIETRTALQLESSTFASLSTQTSTEESLTAEPQPVQAAATGWWIKAALSGEAARRRTSAAIWIAEHFPLVAANTGAPVDGEHATARLSARDEMTERRLRSDREGPLPPGDLDLLFTDDEWLAALLGSDLCNCEV